MTNDQAVERRPRTKRQRSAAAGHSRKHRDAQRAAGVPTGRRIDTAIASLLLRQMSSPKGLHATTENLLQLRRRLIREEGWDDEKEEITQAIDARFRFLMKRNGGGEKI